MRERQGEGGRGGCGGPSCGGAVGGRYSRAQSDHHDFYHSHSHTHSGTPRSPTTNGDTQLSTFNTPLIYGESQLQLSALMATLAVAAPRRLKLRHGAATLNQPRGAGVTSTTNGSMAPCPSLKSHKLVV